MAATALYPPQAYEWLGDVYTALASQSKQPAQDWADAEHAYESSRSAWSKIAPTAVTDTPVHLAALDTKLARCGVALRAAR